jgi:quercetin dioxygenase-like cupin family protein
VDPELEPLLAEPCASAWARLDPPDEADAGRVRARLLGRAGAAAAEAAPMITSRLRRLPAVDVAPGASIRTLYAAPDDRLLRPGEPLRARVVALQPGACWIGPDPRHHREWLVLSGRVRLGGELLAEGDYHVAPGGTAEGPLACDEAALVFLRESAQPRAAADAAFTLRDANADWPAYAPGIRRRVLWQHDGQAALLYHADAGASVPLHTHGHDEECLMVRGELFLDDVLLQEGDYQLAPAGSRHRVTETDTGVVIYAHGDLDMQFVG